MKEMMGSLARDTLAKVCTSFRSGLRLSLQLMADLLNKLILNMFLCQIFFTSMIFNCVVPFKIKKKKNSGFIAATLYFVTVEQDLALCTVAKFTDLNCVDKDNSGIVLSSRPAMLHGLAGRSVNPMPELTLSPSH
jgi:hypothetical protein